MNFKGIGGRYGVKGNVTILKKGGVCCGNHKRGTPKRWELPVKPLPKHEVEKTRALYERQADKRLARREGKKLILLGRRG